jgi:hypothetical protein
MTSSQSSPYSELPEAIDRFLLTCRVLLVIYQRETEENLISGANIG